MLVAAAELAALQRALPRPDEVDAPVVPGHLVHERGRHFFPGRFDSMRFKWEWDGKRRGRPPGWSGGRVGSGWRPPCGWAVGLWMATSKRRPVTDDEHTQHAGTGAPEPGQQPQHIHSEIDQTHPTGPVLGWAGAAGSWASTLTKHTHPLASPNSRFPKSQTASALLQSGLCSPLLLILPDTQT